MSAFLAFQNGSAKISHLVGTDGELEDATALSKYNYITYRHYIHMYFHYI